MDDLALRSEANPALNAYKRSAGGLGGHAALTPLGVNGEESGIRKD